MDTIICTLCGEEKELNKFYKHKGMPSGYTNQCKECVKKRAKIREIELRKNPLWVEKEKERGRNKYHRLNYKEKQKVWNEKRPWTKSNIYKGLNKKLKLKETETAHHWNYNFLEDVFIIEKKLHRKLHKYLTIDEDTFCFITMEGNLLDTKEKHEYYINIISNLK